MDSVCRTLEAILGESGKMVILYYIKNNHDLPVDEIVRKPREFADALENIFGIGTCMIEVSILKNMYKDLGLSYNEDKKFDFAQHLREAIAQGKNKAAVM